MRGAYYSAHPLCLSIEIGVPEKAANERGDFILPDVHNNQTIVLMAERWPLASGIDPNLLRRYPRCFQQESLVGENILVRNDQARARSSTYSGTVYWAEWSRNAWLANRTASEMASWETAPRHSSTIVSQATPLATCSMTSATGIRVPRKVGWPWQIAGSQTTYRPIIRVAIWC